MMKNYADQTLQMQDGFESSLVEGYAEDADGSTHAVPILDRSDETSLGSQLMGHTDSDGQPSWLGKMLGRYRLTQVLGHGAMGVVIQAMDMRLERLVALKIFSQRVRDSDEKAVASHAFREARAAARVHHPNVVSIHEIDQFRGWWYIAMELVEGSTLKELVEATGPMSPIRACSLICDAATGLAAAHLVGVVHRDIKPTNLIVNRSGRCKVADFGLVRLFDANSPFDFTRSAVGTPSYMSPEIIEKGDCSPKSDVYSLGATFFYLLAGQPPFNGRTMDDIFQMHLTQSPPDIRRYQPKVPAHLAGLITRMLEKKPVNRPQMAEVATILRAEAINPYALDPAIDPNSTSVLFQDRAEISTFSRRVPDWLNHQSAGWLIAIILGFFLAIALGFLLAVLI